MLPTHFLSASIATNVAIIWRQAPLFALLGLSIFLPGCRSIPVNPSANNIPLADESSASDFVPVPFARAPKRENTPAITGRVLSASDLQGYHPQATLSDRNYAEVNSRWLRQFYPRFRNELFRGGVVKWDSRFNCKHFTGLYVELAQARFYMESFHQRTNANTLALGQVWYHRDNDRGGHAIVVAFTERGRVYIEPQTGEETRLSPSEQASIFMTQI